MYKRISIFSPEIILPMIQKGGKVILSDKIVRVGSTRLKTYLSSQQCAFCDRTISFFALETTVNQKECWHLNPYHQTSDGREIMFTSDHIIPRARGGLNGISNRQPSCGPCNFKKGDRLPNEDKSPRELLIKPIRKKEGAQRRFKNVVWHPSDSKAMQSIKSELMIRCNQLTNLLKARHIPFKQFPNFYEMLYLANNPQLNWEKKPDDIVDLIREAQDLIDQFDTPDPQPIPDALLV